MDADLIVKNLLPNIFPWWDTIKIAGQFVGFIIAAIGIRGFVAGGRQQANIQGAVLAFVAGVCMLNVISILDIFAMSMLDKASETGLEAPLTGGDPSDMYIQIAVYIVMLVGLTGVIYGFVLLKRSAEEGRLVGSAITHIVGGTLGVNIVEFMKLLGNSMGSSIGDVVNRIFGS